MKRRPEEKAGEARRDSGLDEAERPPRTTNDTGPGLLGAVLARENLLRAMKQVQANKGAAGVDGLDINQTAMMLRTHWPSIPTVLDRLIQQALLQVLQGT